eukprot:283414_1
MALQTETIVRIKVCGAGLLDVNGSYDVCNSYPKFPSIELSTKYHKINHSHHNTNIFKPEFMYVHLRKLPSSKEWEYGIYLQPLPEMGYDPQKLVWVLARINIDGDKNKKPIIFYCAPRKEKLNIPPTNTWIPVGGIEPTPKCQLIELQLPSKKTSSPLRKAIEEANKDDSKMEEMMFDRTGSLSKNDKKKHLAKGDKGAPKKQIMTQPRRAIFQPGSSKDMRRVR